MLTLLPPACLSLYRPYISTLSCLFTFFNGTFHSDHSPKEISFHSARNKKVTLTEFSSWRNEISFWVSCKYSLCKIHYFNPFRANCTKWSNKLK